MFIHPDYIPLIFKDQSTIRVVVNAGELLKRCVEYHTKYKHVVDNISHYVKTNYEKGDYTLPVSLPISGSNIFGIKFVDHYNKIPAGWNKPNKYATSFPNKNLAKEFKDFPVMPSPYNIFEGIIPTDIEYASKMNKIQGSSAIIGRRFEPGVAWYDNADGSFTYFMEIPNIEYHKRKKFEEFKKYYKEEKDIEITGPEELLNWKWPEELSAMTDSYYRLIWAKHKAYKDAIRVNQLIAEYTMEKSHV